MTMTPFALFFMLCFLLHPITAGGKYPPEKCAPNKGIDFNKCKPRIENCPDIGVTMKWNGANCHRNYDTGCQCDTYCGYTCKGACNNDPQCIWKKDIRRKYRCFNRNMNVEGYGMPICNMYCDPPSVCSTKEDNTLACGESGICYPLAENPSVGIAVDSSVPCDGSVCTRNSQCPRGKVCALTCCNGGSDGVNGAGTCVTTCDNTGGIE